MAPPGDASSNPSLNLIGSQMHSDTQAPVSNQVPRRPAAAESSHRPTRKAACNAAAIVGLSLAAVGTTPACSSHAPVGDPAESVGAVSEALTCSSASLYTTGDFNGDGKQDLIITNTSGSYWYISNGDGTWKQSYVRTDLTQYNTQYVVGDFNGDHVDDMLIYVQGTSYLYISNGDGTFTGNVWVGNMRPMAVGDFNGDGKKDLIAPDGSNPNAIQIYLSNFAGKSGSWDTSWGQAPGTPGDDSNFRFTVGNFDGGNGGGGANRCDDLLVTGSSGSTLYYSSCRGAWTAGLARPDLTIYNTFYTAGDFNGDGNADLIIGTPVGSFWYFANKTTRGFTPDVYVDGNLKVEGYSGWNWGGATALLNNPTYPTSYQIVDLDADGRKDVLIQNVSGTGAYRSGYTGTSGSWTQAWSLGPAKYVIAGDFNHDGGSDILVEDSTGTHGFFSSIPQGIRACVPGFCTPNFPTYTAKPDTGTPVWSRGDLAVNNMEGVGIPFPFWGGGAIPPGNLRQPACFSKWEGPCLNQGCDAGLKCVTPSGSGVGGTNSCQSTCPGLNTGDCCLPDGTCAGRGLTCKSGVCEPSCAGGGAQGQPCCDGLACAAGNTCVSPPQGGAAVCETTACGTQGARCCTNGPTCHPGLACGGGFPGVCQVPSTCTSSTGGNGQACCPGNECQAGLSCTAGCVGFATPICTAGCVNGGGGGGGGSTCNVAGDPCCVTAGVGSCEPQGAGVPLFCCNARCQTNPSCPQ
jgi:FG-GAP-like repeat/FG-GAP repeat